MTRRTAEEAMTITDDANDVIENALTIRVDYELSDNRQLSDALGAIAHQIDMAAALNVQSAIEASGVEFTAIEIQSMTQVESFRQIGGMDLTATLLRAYKLRQIQESNLIAYHPERFHNLSEMASKNGCSTTEMHFVLDFVNILAPFIVDDLGIDLYSLWADVGKSKLKEMMPILKSLITGEEANSVAARNAVEALMEDQLATMANTPQYMAAFEGLQDEGISDDGREVIQTELNREARRFAVGHLIELGGQLPTNMLRRHIRPDRTPPIQVWNVGEQDGHNIYLIEADEDQITMLRNRLGERVEIQALNLPVNRNARQAEALRIPAIRHIYQLVNLQ